MANFPNVCRFCVILYDEKGTEVARQYVSRLEGSSLDLQLNGKLGRRVRIQLRQKKSSSQPCRSRGFSICS